MSLFPAQNSAQRERKFSIFQGNKKGLDWLIRGPVFTGWGSDRGIFYLTGVRLGHCDLHFTAHLVSRRSVLPFSSLNGEGHFKIGKLCVENSAWFPTVPSLFECQNWLLLTVFS